MRAAALAALEKVRGNILGGDLVDALVRLLWALDAEGSSGAGRIAGQT